MATGMSTFLDRCVEFESEFRVWNLALSQFKLIKTDLCVRQRVRKALIWNLIYLNSEFCQFSMEMTSVRDLRSFSA